MENFSKVGNINLGLSDEMWFFELSYLEIAAKISFLGKIIKKMSKCGENVKVFLFLTSSLSHTLITEEFYFHSDVQ